MIEYVCEACHKRKKPSDDWILGFAAEAVGSRSARREINIFAKWLDEQATNPMAVHFCSERCRDKYMNWLFNHNLAS